MLLQNAATGNFLVIRPSVSKRFIQRSINKSLQVGILVTDENPSVIAMVGDNFPNVKHKADPSHLNNSIIRSVSNAVKKKDHKIHYNR